MDKNRPQLFFPVKFDPRSRSPKFSDSSEDEAEGKSFLSDGGTDTPNAGPILKPEVRNKYLEGGRSVYKCGLTLSTLFFIILLIYTFFFPSPLSFTSSSTTPDADGIKPSKAHIVTTTSPLLETKKLEPPESSPPEKSRWYKNKFKSDGFEIDVEVKESPVDGLGLFTKEFIPKGTKVWQNYSDVHNYNSTHHHVLKKYLKLLNEVDYKYFVLHSYTFQKAIRLANSMYDYINHNNTPNVCPNLPHDGVIACRDIQKGEELFRNNLLDLSGTWLAEKVMQFSNTCVNFRNFFRTTARTISKFCKKSILYNLTWAETYAPLVDKIEGKKIVAALNTSVLIPKTFFSIRADNYTSLRVGKMLERLPKRFVVKPAHYSGGVAKVDDDQFICLKLCIWISPKIQSRHHAMKRLLRIHLNYYLHKHYRTRGQNQYDYITPGMLFEEYINFSLEKGYSEFGFHVYHGAILYVTVMCDREHFAYFNADWEELHIRDHDPFQPCLSLPKQPGNWGQMKSIAEKLGTLVPRARVDLFTNNTHVYFSELTLTPDGCEDKSYPIIHQKLSLWMYENPDKTHLVTPEVVKCLINEKQIIMDPL